LVVIFGSGSANGGSEDAAVGEAACFDFANFEELGKAVLGVEFQLQVLL
jgi:hypothetical protein